MKFPIKNRYFLYALVIIYTLLSLTINFFVFPSRSEMADQMRPLFKHSVDFKSRTYFFPNLIFISGAHIFLDEKGPRRDIIRAPAVGIQFDLNAYTKRDEFIVRNMVIFNPTVHDYKLFQEELAHIITASNEGVPRESGSNFRIFVRNLTFQIPGGQTGKHQFDINFAKKRHFIGSSGSIQRIKIGNEEKDADILPFKDRNTSQPIRYALKGQVLTGGLLLDEIEIFKDNLYAKFWGKSDKNELDLEGNAFLNLMKRDLDEEDEQSKLMEGLKNLIKQVPVSRLSLSDVNVHILDIQARLLFMPSQVDIDGLDFIINNVPVRLRGSAGYLDSPAFALEVSSYEDLAVEKRRSVNHFEVSVEGGLQDSKIITSGRLVYHAALSPYAHIEPGRITVEFTEMASQYKDFQTVQSNVKRIQMFCCGGKNERELIVNDIEAFFYMNPGERNILEIFAPVYDGRLRGRAGFFDSPVWPQITFQLELKDIDVNQLTGISPDFSSIKGRLNALTRFYYYPSRELKGSAAVHNARLNNFKYLNSIAAMFNIPGLESMELDQVSADFEFNQDGLGFRNLRLNSRDVNFKGFFQVDKNRLVSSECSLILSRSVLQRSGHLRAVVEQVDDAVDSLSFDFLLSGRLDAMNFQWAESEAKSHIQKRIPPFIQKAIESRIEYVVTEKPKERKNQPGPQNSKGMGGK